MNARADIGLEESKRRGDITERARTADIGEGFDLLTVKPHLVRFVLNIVCLADPNCRGKSLQNPTRPQSALSTRPISSGSSTGASQRVPTQR